MIVRMVPLLRILLPCFFVFFLIAVVDHRAVTAFAPPPTTTLLGGDGVRSQARPRRRLPPQQQELNNNNQPAAYYYDWTRRSAPSSPGAAAPAAVKTETMIRRRRRRRGSSSLLGLRARTGQEVENESFDDDDDDSNNSKESSSTLLATSAAAAATVRDNELGGGSGSEKDAAAATTTTTVVPPPPPFLTPYNLLHPASFPVTVEGRGDDPNRGGPGTTTATPVRSLPAVLGLLRQSLRRIIDCEENSGSSGSEDGGGGTSNNDALLLVAEQLRRATASCSATTTNSNNNNTTVVLLRIEHRLDRNTDALAWLRAQSPPPPPPDRNNNNRQQQQQQQQHDGAATAATTTRLYLQTRDRLEAACVGAAVVAKRTGDLFAVLQQPNDNNGGGLPQNTAWYGGARFDSRPNGSNDNNDTDDSTTTATDANSPNNSEWRAFGEAHWIIPAVELVRRRTHSDGDDGDGGWEATLAVHLVADDESNTSNSSTQQSRSFRNSARRVLRLLERLTPHAAPAGAATAIPPILSRDRDGPEEYERAVGRALEALETGNALQKVVLARRQRLRLRAPLNGLDVLARWKYGSGHRDEGGHLFWMQLLDSEDDAVVEFFGCTPERLFSVTGDAVASEALAGTRPRGSTREADAALLQELMTSGKDWRENQLTAGYITGALDRLHARGWVTAWNGKASNRQNRNEEKDKQDLELSATQLINQEASSSSSSSFFVRRLRHVQHICQRYSAELIHNSDSIGNKQSNSNRSLDVARFLLTELHPTPAVCGLPMQAARDFIRQHESISFDRGFYAGPFGYIGRDNSEILVAIRSALAVTPRSGGNGGTTISSYAGAGLVRGSTLEEEWSEINYKFAVIASLFPQSPVTLRSAPTPNVAWCTAWIEELLRHGVTRFYVCPGSRSTPLVAAVARAVRANTGVVHAVSVHDERAAGFRAVGYAKGCGQPAAVITSSGTAVSNLYPAVVEAGMDGVPLLLLTADRPYEARATGANQAIDQVKTFGESYLRWFRDVLPATDEVKVSVILSDAGHAVDLARQLRGPVHVNFQFRENLAPEAGPIRNDDRIGSFTKFDGMRFTDVPGFARWSESGGKWSSSYSTMSSLTAPLNAVQDVARLIEQSQRGIIVVGNLRTSTSEIHKGDQQTMLQAISDFAKAVGFPIFAGAQSANLRFTSSAVVPFAEHLLKCPIVSENLRPDLIIQIGAPLISTAIPSAIASAMKADDGAAGRVTTSHVLLHPHFPHERADPEFTVTHKINAEISPFLNDVTDMLSTNGVLTSCSSKLAPLVLLGRILQPSMKSLIHEATESVILEKGGMLPMLSEPEITVALSDVFGESVADRSLFLSNSMPVRDAEFFFYPFSPLEGSSDTARGGGPTSVGTNRGASGIDGIISSALGFSESTEAPTTLLIGDLATLHDIGSLHSVANNALIHKNAHNINKHLPLTTVIVNNDGGGIFSFLPIAKHGKDVAFDEFFGTPTSSFSFEKGAEAFGLPCEVASDYDTFRSKYKAAAELGKDSIVEARVVDRSTNVAIHRKITRGVEYYVTSLLFRKPQAEKPIRLPVKVYCRPSKKQSSSAAAGVGGKTLVLLHGWMGDKLEWDETVNILCDKLVDSEWKILSVDLPGHGGSPYESASSLQALRSALYLDEDEIENEEGENLNVDSMARSVLASLSKHHGIEKINAIAGYSLGGRVALAMKRLCLSKSVDCDLVDPTTAMVLLGANVGDLSANALNMVQQDDDRRKAKDDALAARIVTLSDKICVTGSESEARAAVDSILDRWYSAELWGSLQQNSTRYSEMIEKRSRSLRSRGRDLAKVMSQSSPSRNQKDDWRYCTSERTLFISGGLDKKYSTIGKILKDDQRAQFGTVDGVGHALLVEAPSHVANMLADFLSSDYTEPLPREEEVVIDAESTKSLARMQTTTPEPNAAVIKNIAKEEIPLWSTRADSFETLDEIEYESFSIDLVDGDRNRNGISGVGWGDNAAATTTNVLSSRRGFIVQLRCVNGLEVGLGEISPLSGLHGETLDQAKKQLDRLQTFLQQESPENLPEFEAEGILALNGSLNNLLAQLERSAELAFFPSVRSGLEMALLSLAAQKIGLPIHQAMALQSIPDQKQTSSSTIPVSGLITRHTSLRRSSAASSKSFPSVKVKVGHQTLAEDGKAMLQGFQLVEMYYGKLNGRVRADANRAWNESQAIEFATMLEGIDVHAMEKVEFIEEPLEQIIDETGEWTFSGQIKALERSYQHTGIFYALDESLADLGEMNGWCFENMKKEIEETFQEGPRGCGAFILKPALLGMELSLQLARLARTNLGIGAVFSSSFDSGLGLAYTSFLGHISDEMASAANVYPHGVGIFTMLDADTISPPFESYVNNDGFLNTASLSRALYGLSLDEIRESQAFAPPPPERLEPEMIDEAYESATATSTSGNQISVVVSLPLPFSADTACSKFTDLPSMSRWSPWISSVQYQGTETEWTINVRGIPLKWRAKSEIIDDPFPGIQWQSVSGLNNRGVVEFVADESSDDPANNCNMNVRMTIVTPRILRPLFEGTSLFVEEFLRDKLLKWSLEMFRDSVKADLALERGDVELGDALIGAVEGKASAIEATLNSGPAVNGDQEQ